MASSSPRKTWKSGVGDVYKRQGEVLGTRQTGMMQFRLADFERDKGWIEPVREMAPELMAHPEIVRALVRRWLGERTRYGDV